MSEQDNNINDMCWHDEVETDTKMNKYLHMEKIIETYYELPDISIQNINDKQIIIEIDIATNEIIEILKLNCHRKITSSFNEDIQKILKRTFDDNCNFKNMFPVYLSKQFLNLLQIQLSELKKL